MPHDLDPLPVEAPPAREQLVLLEEQQLRRRREEQQLLSPPVATPPYLPFRQHLLWSACLLIFMLYVTAVLYFFLMSSTFRSFVVNRANTLFALPYILSLLVVLLCLAPCSPTPARPQLDAVITSPADCALVLLVLLEWATCLSLVLVTLIAVHDHLSYVSPDGLILPTDNLPPGPANSTSNYNNSSSSAPFSSNPNTTAPNNFNTSNPSSADLKSGQHSGDGIAHDAVIVLIIPVILMYCLFNCLIHLYSCLEAAWRSHHHYTDLD